MDIAKLESALNIVREINRDEFKQELTNQNTLDALLIELNAISNKIQSQKKRTKEIIEHITDCCLGDLTKKLPISENEDELDVISLGFNTFLEELSATTVSIEKLEEANREILEREKKLDEAQTIAQIGSWEYSFESGITNISKELYRILEVEINSEINLRKLFKSKILPEDFYKYEILKNINTISHTKNEFEFKVQINKFKLKYLLLTTIYDSQQNKIIGTAQDITERRLIDAKLKQLESDNLEHKKKIIEAILITQCFL